jgi:hypothetical protein
VQWSITIIVEHAAGMGVLPVLRRHLRKVNGSLSVQNELHYSAVRIAIGNEVEGGAPMVVLLS